MLALIPVDCRGQEEAQGGKGGDLQGVHLQGAEAGALLWLRLVFLIATQNARRVEDVCPDSMPGPNITNRVGLPKLHPPPFSCCGTA